jgi:hypothetical protein
VRIIRDGAKRRRHRDGALLLVHLFSTARRRRDRRPHVYRRADVRRMDPRSCRLRCGLDLAMLSAAQGVRELVVILDVSLGFFAHR